MANHNFDLIGHIVSSAFGQLSIKTNDQQDFIKNYVQGTLDYLPFDFKPVDEQGGLKSISPWRMKIINNLRLEDSAEHVRRFINPLYPSRLSAIYAFSSEDMCNKVAEDKHWNLSNIYKFKLKPHPLNRVVKTNMYVYDLAQRSYQLGMINEGDDNFLWDSYWNCVECAMNLPDLHTLGKRTVYKSDYLEEYLIEGALERVD